MYVQGLNFLFFLFCVLDLFLFRSGINCQNNKKHQKHLKYLLTRSLDVGVFICQLRVNKTNSFI